MVAKNKLTNEDELLSIYIDDSDLKNLRDFSVLMPRAFDTILSRSLTRAAEGFKKEFVAHMHRDLGYKSKMEAHRGVKVKGATSRRLQAEVWLRASRPAVVKFESADVFPHGVRYRIKGQSSEISHAFEARMPNGHKGFFVRSNKLDPGSVAQGKRMKPSWISRKYGTTPSAYKKKAIFELHGPSVLKYRRTEDALTQRLQKQVQERLNTEINNRFADEMKKYNNG